MMRYMGVCCKIHGYPHVFMIDDSVISMVYDGAHRLACFIVLGERFVKARVIGVISKSIKILPDARS